MKKLIAAALALLLGSTGYVIVDHTLEDRVAVLESQVASQESVLAEYQDNSTTKINSNPDYYKLGDKIKIADRQKYQFNVVYIEGIYVDFGSPYGGIFDIGYSDKFDVGLEIEETFRSDPYKVEITELSAEVVDYKEIEKTTLLDYTTSVTKEYSTKVKVTIKGNTSPELAGKKLKFAMSVNDSFNKDLSLQTTSKYDNSADFNTFAVKSDGSFECVGYTTRKELPKTAEFYFYNLHS